MTRRTLKIALSISLFALLFNFSDASAEAQQFQTRCGWFENPTPANYSLYDRDNEWIFGVQGGYQLEDFEIPIFKKGQWVETPSGSYGYGCACFQMIVDGETHHVLTVGKSYSRPLSVCRKDKALKRKWNFER